MLFFASCATPGFGPTGILFNNVKTGVFGQTPSGTKKGKACARNYFGLVAFGDASVEAAAAKANITKVNNINLEGWSLLVYGSLCTIVQGD